MALITSCAHVEAARRGAAPEAAPIDFADFLIARSRERDAPAEEDARGIAPDGS
jgi:hypothetical protein